MATPAQPVEDGPTLLDRGGAYAILVGWRLVRATGEEAVAWLHDLLTADIAGLASGQSRRTLLLARTGRIRADLTAARVGDDVWLAQAPDQPDAVADLLEPYVLSARVELVDAARSRIIVAVPSATDATVPEPAWSPSVLGPGSDLLVPRRDGDDPGDVASDLREVRGLRPAGPAALEAWRVRRGVVRAGVDYPLGARPGEAGLDDTIDTTKGCFLGQEAVAKASNLGTPPRVVRRVHAERPIAAGDVVLAGGRRVGRVTSAAADGEGWVGFATVARAAATEALTAGIGTPLDDR